MPRFPNGPNVPKVPRVPEVPKVKKVFSGTGSSQELISRLSSTLNKVHLVYGENVNISEGIKIFHIFNENFKIDHILMFFLFWSWALTLLPFLANDNKCCVFFVLKTFFFLNLP